MQFSINKAELMQALTIAQKFINPKITVPDYENFMFRLNKSALTIITSDLNNTVFIELNVLGDESSGEFGIPPKAFMQFLKEVKEDSLLFSISQTQINITTKKGKFSFPTQILTNNIEIQDKANSIIIKSSHFKNGLNKTKDFAYDDGLRPILNTVYLENKDESVSFTATEAHVLSSYSAKNELKQDDVSIMLPIGFVKNVESLLLNYKKETLTINYNESKCHVQLNNIKIEFKLLEGHYVNYRAILREQSKHKCLVDRKSLIHAVKSVTTCANKETEKIKMTFVNNTIKLHAEDINFNTSANVTINADYSNDEFSIFVSYRRILMLLNSISSEFISMEMESNKDSINIIDKDNENEEKHLTLIMPLTHEA